MRKKFLFYFKVEKRKKERQIERKRGRTKKERKKERKRGRTKKERKNKEPKERY